MKKIAYFIKFLSFTYAIASVTYTTAMLLETSYFYIMPGVLMVAYTFWPEII